MRRILRVLIATALLAIVPWASNGHAQDRYPSRNIRLIVSFPPGGGIDAVARVFAEKMTDVLGQPVVVENRGGASGMIAGKLVVNAEPDGYTVLIASNSMIIAQLMNPAGSISIERDLRAIASVAPQANIVVTAPDLKVESLKDVIALAQTRTLNYASPGTGSVTQLSFEQFLTMAKLRMTHVPFPGAAQMLTAMLASQTEVGVVTLPPAVSLVASNKIRGIAVTSPARSVALPQIPTLTELGYPVNATVWTAFFVPAKTPKAIADKLTEAVLKVAALPEVSQKLVQLGFESTTIAGEKFQRDVAAEVKTWAGVIEKANIKPQ